MYLTLFLLLILGVDWASGYAIAGFVMRHGVSPNGYAFWQSFGPLVCLLLIQLVRRDVRITFSAIKYSLVTGLVAIAIPNLLVYYAARTVDSSILTVLANTDPIFTYVLALLLGQEVFRKNRLLCVFVGCIGILIIVYPLGQINNLNIYKWLYLSLLIPFCYSFGIVFISRFRPQQESILNLSLWMLLVSTMVITPVALYTNEFYSLGINYNTFLIILEVVLSTVGYVLMFLLIQRAGPVLFVLVNGVTAIAGLFYGKLLFDQQISLVAYFAIGLIIVAIIGLSLTKKYNIIYE